MNSKAAFKKEPPRLLTDLAIVLRSIPYQERHRVVTALTEQHGQITAIARNSIQSRRFGGSLEPFAAALWHFTQKPSAELVHLSEAHIRRPYEGLRKDFERLSLASVFNELMLKLAPQGEPCPGLFRLHSNALATLEEMPGTGGDLRLLNAYLAKVLQWSGSQPRLQSCLECEISIASLDPGSSLSCVVADAAWICPDCRGSKTRHVRAEHLRAAEPSGGFTQTSLRLSPAAILDFHVSLMLPIRQVLAVAKAPLEEHRELFRFLEALFVFHLPGFDRKPLKSLRFLDLESSARNPPANSL